MVMMYDKSSTATRVNNAILDMFARKQRPYQVIPPTRSPLLQHIKRAVYHAQVGPAEWGWAKNGDMRNVVWTMFPPIVESCQQLTKCGCKSGCHGRCKCYRLGLSPAHHCVVADVILRHHDTPWAKTIKKNTNSTQNKSQTHRAKQYEVTSFLSTDCELSTETCSENVYSLAPCV